MPAPRVFVSSTFYDLRYIRENLKHFINSLGYEAVLSEEGNVFYNPAKNVQDAAVADVQSCQMFVLIIGGRFGTEFKGTEESITNREYRKAVEAKVPIFALVERDVYDQSHVYRSNLDNEAIDRASINYPAVDTPKVFEFIEEVQGQVFNNALVPFSNFGDIQNYLEQQWASMMFTFLTSRSEAERVTDMLGAVTEIGEKVEFLSRQILSKVGDDVSNVAVRLYDEMGNPQYGLLRSFLDSFVDPVPAVVLEFETFDDLVVATGGEIKKKFGVATVIDWAGGRSYGTSGSMDYQREEYAALRGSLVAVLDESGVAIDAYLMSDPTAVERAINSRRGPSEHSSASS